MSKQIVATFAAVVLMSTMVSSASAADAVTVESSQVKINDLDLNTARGVHLLFGQVGNVASTLCFQTDSPVLPRGEHDMWQCRARTIAKAIAKLHQPLVTAEYNRLFGTSPEALAAR